MTTGMAQRRSRQARASYREISLYTTDRTPCAIDLGDNTNLFGVPPAALRVLRDVEPQTISRYPASPFADDLRSALAQYAGVAVDEVTTGCGSDDVIDSALRAFTEPGDVIAFPDPTFAMLPTFALMNGLAAVLVPLTDTFDIDPEAMLATRAKVTYICSPNNPTGLAASPAAIERIIRGTSGLVILDEAYAEFAGQDWASEAPRHEGLLVTRTLSKAFGLAGLRVGYSTGTASLIAEVEKSRGPYKVNSLAEQAAVAALTHDQAWVREKIEALRAGRARFIEALRSRGLSPLPSDANFVLVPVVDSESLAAKMRAGGVAVRPFERLRGIGDALRFTIGPAPMMEAALTALDEAMS